MKLTQSRIPEVVLIEHDVFADDRGWFMESFNEPLFHGQLKALGLPVPRPFVQDNHSCSRAGVLRGLHYQVTPHAQGKLVRVVRGRVFDVAVDLRPSSPTFGQWASFDLSAANRCSLWIPEGFGHGFLALEDDTEFLYKTTHVYAKEFERSIRWNDPTLAIDWPSLPSGVTMIVSAKDASAPDFSVSHLELIASQ